MVGDPLGKRHRVWQRATPGNAPRAATERRSAVRHHSASQHGAEQRTTAPATRHGRQRSAAGRCSASRHHGTASGNALPSGNALRSTAERPLAVRHPFGTAAPRLAAQYRPATRYGRNVPAAWQRGTPGSEALLSNAHCRNESPLGTNRRSPAQAALQASNPARPSCSRTHGLLAMFHVKRRPNKCTLSMASRVRLVAEVAGRSGHLRDTWAGLVEPRSASALRSSRRRCSAGRVDVAHASCDPTWRTRQPSRRPGRASPSGRASPGTPGTSGGSRHGSRRDSWRAGEHGRRPALAPAQRGGCMCDRHRQWELVSRESPRWCSWRPTAPLVIGGACDGSPCS